LSKAIAALNAGDTRDLLNVLDAVGKAAAGFRSLADPMIDTTSPHGKLILASPSIKSLRVRPETLSRIA
jgi:DNA invertase Pin-like site-specific DNA recombinase